MARKCYIFGEYNAPSALLEPLMRKMEQHYTEYGVREFCVQLSDNRFSILTLCAKERLEQKHPDLRLIDLVHADPTDGPVPLAEHFDGAIRFPEGANIPVQMIGIADTAICYAYPKGALRGLLQFARRCHRKGLILLDEIPPQRFRIVNM